MATRRLKRIVDRATAVVRKRHAALREQIRQEFPPVNHASPSPAGIAAQIREAREAKGLTWYALAKLAGIPNSSTIRDIENGRDAQMSNVAAVAKALGLR